MATAKDLTAIKAEMLMLADPDSVLSAEGRVDAVIALVESLHLSSYTPATFPLSDADACDIIGNAAVAICLAVSPLEDNFRPLQARAAGSGELLHTVLHRGMGHPGTASLYPSGAEWMSETAAGLADADCFAGQEVDPSRCCGMLCAQMLRILMGTGVTHRTAETVEAVRREMPAAAVEWLLGVGTEWRWAFPMRFLHDLCSAIRGQDPPEGGSSRGDFVTLLQTMPAVEAACAAAAAAVKPLLCWKFSKGFLHASVLLRFQSGLLDGAPSEAPLRSSMLRAAEAVADAMDQFTARWASLASAGTDQRPQHLRHQQPGDAGAGPSVSRAERKAGKKAARKEAKREAKRDGFKSVAYNLQSWDVFDLEREACTAMQTLSAAPPPGLVAVLGKNRRLVTWMGDETWHPSPRAWSFWTQLVAGVLEVAKGGGACCEEAQQVLQELVLSFNDTASNTGLLLRVACKKDTEVLLEVLDWLPQSARPSPSARLLSLSEAARRTFRGQAEASQLTEISDHEAIVSSALQMFIVTFRTGFMDMRCDKELVCAAAVVAAGRALDSYKANRKLHPDGFPQPCNSAYHALHLLYEIMLASPIFAARILLTVQPHIVFHATLGGAVNDLAAFCLAAQLCIAVHSTNPEGSLQDKANGLLRTLAVPHLLQQLLKRYAWQCDNRVPDGEAGGQQESFLPWWSLCFEPLLLFLVRAVLTRHSSGEETALSTKSIQALLQATPFWKALSVRLLPPDDPLAAPLPTVAAGHPLEPLVAGCRQSARDVLERAACIVTVPGFKLTPEETFNQSRLQAMQRAVKMYDDHPAPQGMATILQHLKQTTGEGQGWALQAAGGPTQGGAPGSLMTALQYVHGRVDGFQREALMYSTKEGDRPLGSSTRKPPAAGGCHEAAPSIQRGPSDAGVGGPGAAAASSQEAVQLQGAPTSAGGGSCGSGGSGGSGDCVQGTSSPQAAPSLGARSAAAGSTAASSSAAESGFASLAAAQAAASIESTAEAGRRAWGGPPGPSSDGGAPGRAPLLDPIQEAATAAYSAKAATSDLSTDATAQATMPEGAAPGKSLKPAEPAHCVDHASAPGSGRPPQHTAADADGTASAAAAASVGAAAPASTAAAVVGGGASFMIDVSTPPSTACTPGATPPQAGASEPQSDSSCGAPPVETAVTTQALQAPSETSASLRIADASAPCGNAMAWATAASPCASGDEAASCTWVTSGEEASAYAFAASSGAEAGSSAAVASGSAAAASSAAEASSSAAASPADSPFKLDVEGNEGDAEAEWPIAKLQEQAGSVANRVIQIIADVAAGLAASGSSHVKASSTCANGSAAGAASDAVAGADGGAAVGGGEQEGSSAMGGGGGLPEPGTGSSSSSNNPAVGSSSSSSGSSGTPLPSITVSSHKAAAGQAPVELCMGAMLADRTLLPVLLQHHDYVTAAIHHRQSAEAGHVGPLPLPLPLLPVLMAWLRALLPGGAVGHLASSEVQEEVQLLLQRLRAVKRRAPKCSKCKQLLQEPMLCSGCRQARYCNKECQRAHWRVHRKKCRQHQQQPVPACV